MDFFVIGATVLVAVLALWNVARVGGDEPTWDLRWRALGPDDRARLAAAGLPGGSLDSLEDPEERALAEGFRSRETRRRAYFDLLAVPLLIFAVALVLAGVIPLSVCGLIIAAYGALRSLVDHRRDQQIKGGTEAGLYCGRRSPRWPAISAIVGSGRSRRSSQPSRGIR